MITGSVGSAKQSPGAASVGILRGDVDVRRMGDTFLAGRTCSG